MSNITGFKDLSTKKDEDKKGKRNELFIGGLDQRGGGSGLSVLGPPPNSPPGVFDSIVQRAKDDNNDYSTSDSNEAHRHITLYRNGFTVDDGPLRDITSEQSRLFLSSLERGQVPPELIPTADRSKGAPTVNIHLVDERHRDYVAPPPPAYIAFSGGSALGVAQTNDGAHIFLTADLAAISADIIDESAPVTVVQVKCANGKKLRIRVNQCASVNQLAVAIVRNGGDGSERFTLSAGFPPREVLQASDSLVDAGLVGAAIVQKSC